MRRTPDDLPDARRHEADGGATGDDEAVLTLVRAHGPMPPYGRVGWEALALRIVAAGRETLAARTGATLADGPEPRAASVYSLAARRAWWQVAAGWIGPATLAAAAVGTVALVVSAGAASSASTGDETAAATPAESAGDWQSTLTAGGSAATAGGAAAATGGTFTRDSLYDAVVTQ